MSISEMIRCLALVVVMLDGQSRQMNNIQNIQQDSKRPVSSANLAHVTSKHWKLTRYKQGEFSTTLLEGANFQEKTEFIFEYFC